MTTRVFYNKGEIDLYGHLSIERIGKMKTTRCPYGTRESFEDNFCGDWCPLFGEHFISDPEIEYSSTVLNICNDREIVFKKLKDNRK